MYLMDAYHDVITDPLRLVTTSIDVAKWIERFRLKHKGITHIAATGTSGMAMAYPVSAITKLPVLSVRRAGGEPGSHSGMLIGQGRVKDYVIVDDFISEGGTMNHIINTIDKFWANDKLQHRPTPRGIFLYQSSRDYPFVASFDSEDRDRMEIEVISS